MSNIKQQRVLIVGGGFAGVKTALDLCGCEEFSITLVSDQADFRYYPALWRAAAGGSRKASVIPLSDIFAGKDLKIAHKRVESLDRKRKVAKTSDGKEIGYDVLILALGSITNFFGIEGLEEYSYGVKSIEEAEKLKQHIHMQLMQDNKPDLNYVVVGAGPTGVELAGELPHYLQRVMKKHGLDGHKIHIDLVDGSPRVLPRMPEDISRAVTRRLSKLGVKLYLGEPVQAETADALMVHGEAIQSHTVIWTAGMANNQFFGKNNFNLTPKHKVVVDDYLQAEPNVYVLGDNAETLYSGMAQTALYDANYVAKHLKRLVAGKTPIPYKPKEPIYVVPVGPLWSAVLWGRVRIYGILGWVLRRAADFVGYYDLEPWWKATKLWMAENSDEEDCPTCKPKSQR